MTEDKSLMKRTIWLRAAALFLLLTLLLSGCSSEAGGRALKEQELLYINGQLCTWPEARLFALAQHVQYSADYGEKIWEVSLGEQSFEAYVKAALLDYLELLYLVDSMSEEEQITLSDAEKATLRRSAEDYLTALGEKGAEALEINEETVYNLMCRVARAKLIYAQILSDMEEISDEEARAIRLEIVTLPASVGLAAAQEALDRLKEAKNTSEVLATVEGAAVRQEILVRGQYSDAFDSIAFSLRTGKWSNVIQADGYFYLLYCISSNVSDETTRNRAVLYTKQRRALLEEAIGVFAQGKTLNVNQPLWDSWTMESMIQFPQVNLYDYLP